jgi:hypothetical protein
MYFPITPVSLTPKNNRYNLMEVFVLIEVVLITIHHKFGIASFVTFGEIGVLQLPNVK